MFTLLSMTMTKRWRCFTYANKKGKNKRETKKKKGKTRKRRKNFLKTKNS